MPRGGSKVGREKAAEEERAGIAQEKRAEIGTGHRSPAGAAASAEDEAR